MAALAVAFAAASAGTADTQAVDIAAVTVKADLVQAADNTDMDMPLFHPLPIIQDDFIAAVPRVVKCSVASAHDMTGQGKDICSS